MSNTIILGLIIAFFASFAIGLFSVSVYVWLGDRADAKASARKEALGHGGRPANDDRIAA